MELAYTKKLADAAGAVLPRASAETDPGTRWFADLVTIKRRKAVFLMHEATGLCVILYGMKKKDLQELDRLAVDSVREFLQFLGMSERAIELIAPSDASVTLTLAGSVNRRATSRMNHTIADAEFQFEERIIPHRIQYAVMRRLNQNMTRNVGGVCHLAFEDFIMWLEEQLQESPFCQPAVRIRAELKPGPHTVLRELWVSPHTPLPVVSQVLCIAFGWQGHHLYEFRRGEQLLFTPPVQLAGFDDTPEHFPAIGEVLKPGESCIWLYDLGDCWEIRLTMLERQENFDSYLPICVRCENPAPPEDCGGVDGACELYQALKDEKHPRHAEARRAVYYSQREFDPGRINRRLRE